MAHADARVLQLAVLENRVGAGEVDELEDAHRVLVRRLEGEAVHAVLVHHDHLPGLDLADEGRAHGVQRARLRRDHVRRLAGQWDVADAQRPEPKRVAQRDQLVGRDDAARIGADDARERAPDHFFP